MKIYFAAPKKFEVIGLVSSLGKGGFTDQGRMDRAINELKNQAAKIGANGVLLAATGDASGGVVGGFSGGVFYGAPVQMKQASGQAILVSEE